MRLRRWWFKCAAQLVLAHVPGGPRLNHLIRRPKMEARFDEWNLKQALLHVRLLRDSAIPLAGETVLEFGCGWKPVFPLIYRLAGCGKVILVDANRHLEDRLFRMTVDRLLERASFLARELGRPEDQMRAELDPQGAVRVSELLDRYGFDYRSPGDARDTGLAPNSIGVVSSRAVLEHVAPRDIEAIFRECRRVLKPTGAMVNTIDHSDHFEFSDKSISRINFLRFSERWWRLIGSNQLVYHNRLRSSEFVDMTRRAGFEIVHLDATPDPIVLRVLENFPLEKSFQRFSPDDLATLTTYLVARPT